MLLLNLTTLVKIATWGFVRMIKSPEGDESFHVSFRFLIQCYQV